MGEDGSRLWWSTTWVPSPIRGYRRVAVTPPAGGGYMLGRPALYRVETDPDRVVITYDSAVLRKQIVWRRR